MHRRAAGRTVVAAGLAACVNSTPDIAPSASTDGRKAAASSVTVYAAASLKSPFTEIASKFEAANPGTKVTLNFAGSSALVSQITQGAPADVFASADSRNMDELSAAGLIDGTPTNFATNVLTIAVSSADPASISSFADLANGHQSSCLRTAVPCGSAHGRWKRLPERHWMPVSEESSVADVLGKVTSGEADAGLVYVTDVKTAGDRVKGITFRESDQAVNTYPIAAMGSSKNKELANAFIAMVTGSAGKRVLGDAGFGAL
uniref:Molybdate-binding protein ModA n=1 Tax=Paenarthrobacter nicotinovorans TaxID=29320 RepID=O31229_PAENI|nr:molybdate-binding periplasmic protein [Paenarthrobacter nicotinovorans]